MKLLATIFILLFALSVAGQQIEYITGYNACYSTGKNEPAIRGLKLGMTVAEVEDILKLKIVLESEKTYIFSDNFRASDKANEVDVGVKGFFFPSISLIDTPLSANTSASKTPTQASKTPTQLYGVEYLSLLFFDGSLYRIYVNYHEETFRWLDEKEFAAFLSEKFNFPKESWKSFSNCDDLEISVTVVDGQGTIRLTDEKTSKIITAKAKKVLDEKKKGFKP